MQAFNELEKTDSAETLFGENFLLENNLKTLSNNFNKKTFTNDIDNISSKIKNNNNNNNSSNNINSNNHKKSASRDYYSPLEKHSDKSFSPKDSQSQKTTPSSYSPQENTTTSRGAGFFNYPKTRNIFLSPTKRMFNNQTNFTANKFEDTIQSQPRQRSMSFTDNFEIKSPGVITKPSNLTKMNLKSMEVRKTSSLDEEYGNRSLFLPSKAQLMTEKPRNVITYKPKSVRARNLRRLSYNPINMIDSSSSTSESDLDKSMAHSECDIRSKMYSSRFQKRRQRYMNKKSHKTAQGGYYRSENSQYSNSSNPGVNGREKLYGSNASIKSAPHYNYITDRKKLLNEDLNGGRGGGGDDKTTLSSSDIDSDEDFNNSVNDHRKNLINTDTRTLTPTPQPVQFSSNFNNIYEFVGKCFNRNFSSSTSNSSNGQQQQQKSITQSAIQQAQQFLQNDYRNYTKRGNKISNSNLDLLYTDFDVSKLTGKSPTTQSYFDIIDYPGMSGKKSVSTILRESNVTGANINIKSSAFQWPDKIHGSTVKQNDLIWQLQQQHEQDIKEKEERHNQQRKLLMENLKIKKSAYSSSSSSTESLNYRQNYMPPSPAP